MKDVKYEKMVKTINELQEKISKDPKNKKLKEELKANEDQLMTYVMNSSKELEVFLRNEKENSLYGDEHSF